MDIEPLIQTNVNLSARTTLGIGGNAECLVEIDVLHKLPAAVAWAKRRAMPVTILGGGSNIVVSDQGIDGLTLVMCTKGLQRNKKSQLTVQAGECWSELVKQCVAKNLAGIECLSGIPGTVGAAPIQNIGAYGQQLSDSVEKVEVFDMDSEQFFTFRHDQCCFDYRYSFFKSAKSRRYIVTQVNLQLADNGCPTVNYPSLKQVLAERFITKPTLSQVAETVLAIRREKSMLSDKNDPWSRSVGSFFINPILNPRQIKTFQNRLNTFNINYAEVPKHHLESGEIKLFCAWLIEQCGFGKGFSVGQVGISEKHSLALVNHESATATELLNLAKRIQQAVKLRFNISLQIEPRLLGR